jgi:Protein of unknown function (DUF2283)
MARILRPPSVKLTQPPLRAPTLHRRRLYTKLDDALRHGVTLITGRCRIREEHAGRRVPRREPPAGGVVPQSDSLSLFVRPGEVVVSREVAPGIIVNLDRDGRPVSVDILAASRRLGEDGIRSIAIDLGHR